MRATRSTVPPDPRKTTRFQLQQLGSLAGGLHDQVVAARAYIEDVLSENAHKRQERAVSALLDSLEVKAKELEAVAEAIADGRRVGFGGREILIDGKFLVPATDKEHRASTRAYVAAVCAQEVQQ